MRPKNRRRLTSARIQFVALCECIRRLDCCKLRPFALGHRLDGAGSNQRHRCQDLAHGETRIAFSLTGGLTESRAQRASRLRNPSLKSGQCEPHLPAGRVKNRVANETRSRMFHRQRRSRYKCRGKGRHTATSTLSERLTDSRFWLRGRRAVCRKCMPTTSSSQ
jgi:hypothetical protein